MTGKNGETETFYLLKLSYKWRISPPNPTIRGSGGTSELEAFGNGLSGANVFFLSNS